MSTIGQKLGGTRRTKGLSVEDVAHATRMHSNIIQSIEDDDFSQFPSVAYARSFIRKYSEHLDVDLSSAIESLNSGANGRLGADVLMGEKETMIHKDRPFRLERQGRGQHRRLDKPGRAPLLLNLILSLLVFSLGIFYFLGYNASTIEEARADITKGLQKAIPFSGKGEKKETVLPVPTGDLAGKSMPAAPASPNPVSKPEVSSPLVKISSETPATLTPAPPLPGADSGGSGVGMPPEAPLRAVPITKAP